MSTPYYAWVKYDDCGHVLELEALYNDALKKNDVFIAYAVNLAQRIAEDLNLRVVVTWGKWGARLEPKHNPDYSEERLEDAGRSIISHEAWRALMLSTKVFTFGNSDDGYASWLYERRGKLK